MPLAMPAWAGKPGGPPAPTPANPEIAYIGAYNALWVMDADGSHQTALYPTGKPPRGQVWNIGPPCWSPDGTHIAFRTSSSKTFETEESEVWVVEVGLSSGVPAALSAKPLFVDENQVGGSVRWSLDGQTIAFERFTDEDGNFTGSGYSYLWLVPIQPRVGCPDPLGVDKYNASNVPLGPDDLLRNGCGDLVLEGFVPDFAWSPDDSQLIYGGPSSQSAGNWALMSLELETGEITEIVGTAYTSIGYGYPLYPDLVRSGGVDKLSFHVPELRTNPPTPHTISGSIGTDGVFHADGEFVGGGHPTWSPDGMFIAVQGTNGRILKLDLANKKYTTLNNGGAAPDWLKPPPQQP